MIHASLSFLTRELNAFIRLKDPLNTAGAASGLVALSSIVDQENKLYINRDTIFLTLVNTEEETVGKSQLPYHRTPDDTLHIENPDIKLNLYLLFSAYASTEDNGQLP
ncbi:MAG TPA: Pvc16 family protein, partial [Phnomibacter sp.]|nr:Pvc16 family protein [Phnomibacter sp.]